MHESTLLADQAIAKLIRDYRFVTVLDIGCGSGAHTRLFQQAGKDVTPIDLDPQFDGVVCANYLEYEFGRIFDCIWLSHVLEHQPNVQLFLNKVFRDLRDGGILAVTVPPLKHEIVGGHLSLWNAGLLLYNLIIAGFDCSRAAVKSYGYNITVITPKIPVSLPLQTLRFARGDIEILAQYFPQSRRVEWKQAFRGDIREINWDGVSERHVRRLPAKGQWFRKMPRLTPFRRRSTTTSTEKAPASSSARP